MLLFFQSAAFLMLQPSKHSEISSGISSAKVISLSAKHCGTHGYRKRSFIFVVISSNIIICSSRWYTWMNDILGIILGNNNYGKNFVFGLWQQRCYRMAGIPCILSLGAATEMAALVADLFHRLYGSLNINTIFFF